MDNLYNCYVVVDNNELLLLITQIDKDLFNKPNEISLRILDKNTQDILSLKSEYLGTYLYEGQGYLMYKSLDYNLAKYIKPLPNKEIISLMHNGVEMQLEFKNIDNDELNRFYAIATKQEY